MINLSNLSLEELNVLESKIHLEIQERSYQRKKEAWENLLDAVEKYEKASCGYGISGTDSDGEDYSIEFCAEPGCCHLYHYA